MSEYLIPVEPMDSLPAMPWAEKLAYLAYEFRQLEQVPCPLEHGFEGTDYVRRIAIPKGTLFIGRIHKIGHGVELLSGSVLHIREKCRRIVHAPFELKTQPGDQVCALALTDITAKTVHPAQGCTDIEALEERYFETAQSLIDQGEKVHERLERITYERDSRSGWGRGSSGGHRYSCGRI